MGTLDGTIARIRELSGIPWSAADPETWRDRSSALEDSALVIDQLENALQQIADFAAASTRTSVSQEVSPSAEPAVSPVVETSLERALEQALQPQQDLERARGQASVGDPAPVERGLNFRALEAEILSRRELRAPSKSAPQNKSRTKAVVWVGMALVLLSVGIVLVINPPNARDVERAVSNAVVSLIEVITGDPTRP